MEPEAPNPVLVDVFRGPRVESWHRGALAIADAEGTLVLALGDVARPVYPRSAVKALQALPLIESGAADALGLTSDELAVACASHVGDQVHLDAVASLLAKAGLDESALACGAHWPVSERTTEALVREGRPPRAIHNNCSGKHAGMLAAAVQLGLDPNGYERLDHPLQVMIGRILSETCGVDFDPGLAGIDGCSLPTFALPLEALARSFARFGTGQGLPPERAATAQRLMQACFASPVLVSGKGRFDTRVVGKLGPAAFTKGGAEGVHCAALPELGLGVALKIDDGAKRAAEQVMGAVLAALVPGAETALSDLLDGEMQNWRGRTVGRMAASLDLAEALAALGETRDGRAILS